MPQITRDWREFALLLIDVQESFWPALLAEEFPDFPANVERLLDFCRAEGIMVVHVRAIFQPDKSDWMPTFKLRGVIPCVAGTAGAEPLPCAAALPGEPVIFKQTFNGFMNPDLEELLRQRGVRFVLTAGLVTSTCVLFTTAAAMERGLLAAVVEDCCADERPAHRNTLNQYNFIFSQAPVDALAARYEEWRAALDALALSATPA